jgi:hypothetical protein
VNERDTALMSIYESIKDRVSFDFHEFQRRVAAWEIVPLKQAEQVIGGVLIRGNELHVGFSRRPLGSPLKFIRQTLAVLLHKFGSAITMVDETNANGLRFCQRLGFDVTEHKNGRIYLKCLRCKYV